jgi:hypothetical protein
MECQQWEVFSFAFDKNENIAQMGGKTAVNMPTFLT